MDSRASGSRHWCWSVMSVCVQDKAHWLVVWKEAALDGTIPWRRGEMPSRPAGYLSVAAYVSRPHQPGPIYRLASTSTYDSKQYTRVDIKHWLRYVSVFLVDFNAPCVDKIRCSADSGQIFWLSEYQYNDNVSTGTEWKHRFFVSCDLRT